MGRMRLGNGANAIGEWGECDWGMWRMQFGNGANAIVANAIRHYGGNVANAIRHYGNFFKFP